MVFVTRRALGVIAALLLALAGGEAYGRFPPFAEGTFADAAARADREGKWLIVYATLEGCASCGAHLPIWWDPGVVEWLEAHAVATLIDTVREREIAERLGVQTAPVTALAIRNGRVFDRVSCRRSAAELRAWFEDLTRGETEGQRLRRDAGNNVEARLRLARTCVEASRFEEASSDYVWLWGRLGAGDAVQRASKRGIVAEEMRELALRFGGARSAFRKLRDVLEASLRAGEASLDDLEDWVVLNGVVREPERTEAWALRVRGTEEGRATLHAMAERVFPLLVERGEWSAAGEVYASGIAEARRARAAYESEARARDWSAKPADVAARADLERAFLDRMSVLSGALYAAGREEEGRAVAEELLSVRSDAMARSALARQALRAGSVRAEHLAWLDAAPGTGQEWASLRERVAGALEDAGPVETP